MVLKAGNFACVIFKQAKSFGGFARLIMELVAGCTERGKLPRSTGLQPFSRLGWPATLTTEFWLMR